MPDVESKVILQKIQHDEALSSFEKYVLEIQLVLAEYREVCINVRTGWEYIVTLLRQFIITQLILIPLVAIMRNENIIFMQLPNCDNCSQVVFSMSAAVLMIFGAVFSLFVCAQSYRLFVNSQEFVNRARALENLFSFGDLHVYGETNVMPTFTYMEDRLRTSPVFFEMKPVLTVVYSGVSLTWGIVLVLYINQHFG